MRLRRSIVHVLLSLLLLMSQQMVISHAYAHWIGEQSETQLVDYQVDGKPVKLLAGEHYCAQCHVVSQLAFASISSGYALASDNSVSHQAAIPPTYAACLLTECVFQPRAPPIA